MTRTDRMTAGRMRQPASAVLGCYSNFTFLTGAAHPDEMVATAAALGWQAIGIAESIRLPALSGRIVPRVIMTSGLLLARGCDWLMGRTSSPIHLIVRAMNRCQCC